LRKFFIIIQIKKVLSKLGLESTLKLGGRPKKVPDHFNSSEGGRHIKLDNSVVGRVVKKLIYVENKV